MKDYKSDYDQLKIDYDKLEQRLSKIMKISDKQSNSIMKLNIELEEMAYKDPMTNAYNRRYFFETGEKMLSFAKRENHTCTVAMMDIDKFKNVNDTYGHDVGDSVIIDLSNNINELLRQSDIFARFGGEEFAVIYQNTNIDDAKKVSEKIRQAIEKSCVNDLINYTISIGISSVDLEKDTLDNALKQADKALYVAKQNGRNQVQVYKQVE